MNHTQYYQEQQEAKQLHDRISSFLEDFKVGTLLGGSGIRKLRGAKPLAVFATIFSLPFSGVNFSRGIVNNPELPFRKDAAYEFLKNPRYNWRKFLLGLVTVVVRFMDVLTSEQREKVLIIDDSTYDRSRSKVVELLAWIHDHNANRSLKGFKLMTLGWSDGVSFLPLDFAICSSAKASKRLQGIRKEVDKRCCGYKRRLEAMAKSTEHLESMVKRVLALGIRADYLLMDSWFAFPALGQTSAGDLHGQGHAEGLLPASRAMADFGQGVCRIEETAGQGQDSGQRGGGNQKGTEGQDRVCPPPP